MQVVSHTIKLIPPKELSREPAFPVQKLSQIEHLIPGMLELVNGHFQGKYAAAYAIHHAQVDRTPWNFFVVHRDLVDQGHFPHAVIINPRIVSIPETVGTEHMVKNEKGKDVEKMTKNVFPMFESCMSFPWRTGKHVDRAMQVKVEFQTPGGLLGLKKHKKTVSKISSHIFQHECEHAQGRNMFYQ